MTFVASMSVKGFGGLMFCAIVFLLGTVFTRITSRPPITVRQSMLLGGLPPTLVVACARPRCRHAWPLPHRLAVLKYMLSHGLAQAAWCAKPHAAVI